METNTIMEIMKFIIYIFLIFIIVDSFYMVYNYCYRERDIEDPNVLYIY